MDKITVAAPAKINLFLEVHGKKDDGYHNIESVMQTVSLSDTIEIERNDDETALTCTDEKLTCGPDNLILKAAGAFFAAMKITGGALFRLTKIIPIAAGLGGGSSDAAATLIGLNKLYETNLTVSRLCAIGSEIGADVPFCVRRGTCYVSGIGETLKRCPDIPDCHIVIAIGNGRISTRWAFHRIDDIPERRTEVIDGMRSAISQGKIEDIAGNLYNVFETVSPYEVKIKHILLESGAFGTTMSGSGPAIFGIFGGMDKASDANDALTSHGYKSFICRPVAKQDAGSRI
jgi:4-diphosphocytidyl-2-C-methyl-D-erythritol kinase